MCGALLDSARQDIAWPQCHSSSHGNPGVLAAPRSIFGARYLAKLASENSQFWMHIGLVSSGNGNPYRRVDDGTVHEGGSLSTGTRVVGPASFVGQGQSRNLNQDYRPAQRSDSIGRSRDAWLMRWNISSSAIPGMGLCLRPMYTTVESALQAV